MFQTSILIASAPHLQELLGCLLPLVGRQVCHLVLVHVAHSSTAVRVRLQVHQRRVLVLLQVWFVCGARNARILVKSKYYYITPTSEQLEYFPNINNITVFIQIIIHWFD